MKNQFIIAALLLVVACKTNRAPADCKGLREIVIYDKFSKVEGIRKETVFNEKKTLSHFCEQIVKLQPITTEPVVRTCLNFKKGHRLHTF